MGYNYRESEPWLLNAINQGVQNFGQARDRKRADEHLRFQEEQQRKQMEMQKFLSGVNMAESGATLSADNESLSTEGTKVLGRPVHVAESKAQRGNRVRTVLGASDQLGVEGMGLAPLGLAGAKIPGSMFDKSKLSPEDYKLAGVESPGQKIERQAQEAHYARLERINAGTGTDEDHAMENVPTHLQVKAQKVGAYQKLMAGPIDSTARSVFADAMKKLKGKPGDLNSTTIGDAAFAALKQSRVMDELGIPEEDRDLIRHDVISAVDKIQQERIDAENLQNYRTSMAGASNVRAENSGKKTASAQLITGLNDIIKTTQDELNKMENYGPEGSTNAKSIFHGKGKPITDSPRALQLRAIQSAAKHSLAGSMDGDEAAITAGLEIIKQGTAAAPDPNAKEVRAPGPLKDAGQRDATDSARSKLTPSKEFTPGDRAGAYKYFLEGDKPKPTTRSILGAGDGDTSEQKDWDYKAARIRAGDGPKGEKNKTPEEVLGPRPK